MTNPMNPELLPSDFQRIAGYMDCMGTSFIDYADSFEITREALRRAATVTQSVEGFTLFKAPDISSVGIVLECKKCEQYTSMLIGSESIDYRCKCLSKDTLIRADLVSVKNAAPQPQAAPIELNDVCFDLLEALKRANEEVCSCAKGKSTVGANTLCYSCAAIAKAHRAKGEINE